MIIKYVDTLDNLPGHIIYITLLLILLLHAYIILPASITIAIDNTNHTIQSKLYAIIKQNLKFQSC